MVAFTHNPPNDGSADALSAHRHGKSKYSHTDSGCDVYTVTLPNGSEWLVTEYPLGVPSAEPVTMDMLTED